MCVCDTLGEVGTDVNVPMCVRVCWCVLVCVCNFVYSIIWQVGVDVLTCVC